MERHEKNTILKRTLEEMLERNEDISARAVVRRLPNVFKSPTSITRDSTIRRGLLQDAVAEQERIRSIAGHANNKSRQEMKFEIAKLKERLALAEADRDLLAVSHRLMLRAVGEIGGTAAWLRFFEDHKDVYTRLEKIGAVRSNKTPIAVTFGEDTNN